MRQLTLYFTSGCHLCELAEDILWPLLDELDLSLKQVDIAESDELIEAYGVRIPVLRAEGCNGDLGWPFDETQVRQFLTEP